MTETRQPMRLNNKLFTLRKYVDVVKKSKSGYGYKYASIEEILAKLKAGMEKYHVMLEPHYIPGTAVIQIDHYEKTKQTKNGDTIKDLTHEFIVQQEIIWRWIDLDSGEEKDIHWIAYGEQADPSQALGGAMTYAQRQFLTQYFQIATPESDPDNYRSQKEEAEAEANYEVTQQIIKKIDEHVTAYLELNENTDEAKKALSVIVKKYVKNGSKPTADYRNHLTDPQIAAILLEQLQASCPLTTIKEEEKKSGGKKQ